MKIATGEASSIARQLAIGARQFRGPLLHAQCQVAGIALQLGRRGGQPAIQPAGLDQHDREDKARREEPVDPAAVKAEIEPSGVEHRAESDIGEPGDHHHDQPQIEHRVRPVDDKGEQGRRGE